MTTQYDSPQEVIEGRMRTETKALLTGVCITLTFQGVLTAGWLLCRGTEDYRGTNGWLGMILVPCGWVIPILLAILFARRRSLRQDLNGEPVGLSNVEIIKRGLNMNDNIESPYDDQYVKLSHRRGSHLLPLEYWSAMPEKQVSDCQFFSRSKVIISIDGSADS